MSYRLVFADNQHEKREKDARWTGLCWCTQLKRVSAPLLRTKRSRKSAASILLAFLLCGCSARPQHSHWKNVGDPGIPADAACGQRITFEFDDGHKETWIYPCWPQKNVPKCVEGCPVRPVEKGSE